MAAVLGWKFILFGCLDSQYKIYPLDMVCGPQVKHTDTHTVSVYFPHGAKKEEAENWGVI